MLECYNKHSKVGTFEGLFESNTFVYVLMLTAPILISFMLLPKI